MKSALAAVAFVESAKAAMTRPQDRNAYPAFASAMEAAGGFQWEPVPVTSNMYDLMMFHLIGDNAGLDLPSTKGPILLSTGMYSDMLDWLERDDTFQMPVAFQLAQRGYDVWLASGRGRQFSNTHLLWSSSDPVTAPYYWDYTFEDIGMEDV